MCMCAKLSLIFAVLVIYELHHDSDSKSILYIRTYTFYRDDPDRCDLQLAAVRIARRLLETSIKFCRFFLFSFLPLNA